MTMFGAKEAVIAPLMRRLSGDDEERMPRQELLDRFARASWTGLAEPGDRVAGALVAGLGPSAALTAVLDGADAPALLALLVAADATAGSTGISASELRAGLERWAPRRDPAARLLALQQAVRFGVRLLTPEDPQWPSGVDDLGEHAPIALWVRGSVDAVATYSRSIALVGARAATGYGEHVTMEASAGLVDRGYAITSGAAYGIDGMAHRSALASKGTTIAYLAGGVDRFYPSGHDALLTRIVETGAVVSELPCGAAPTKWRFLQRNRLISASSLATVVLEAGWRSGSLNTAGHAAALGRPLGAVPGPVTSAASAGCHRLIRDFDAVCVTSADEMAELAPLRGEDSPRAGDLAAESERRPSSDDTRVLDALSVRSPRLANDIAARAGLAVGRVQAVLGALELDGRVTCRDTGWVAAANAR